MQSSIKNCRLLLVLAASLSLFCASGARANDKAGAFIGGMIASNVLRNMNDRTQAEQQQAYYAQQQARYSQVPQSAPAPAQQPAAQQATAQQRLDQLDKLAAGGYITPDEYKAKKQQILDGM